VAVYENEYISIFGLNRSRTGGWCPCSWVAGMETDWRSLLPFPYQYPYTQRARPPRRAYHQSQERRDTERYREKTDDKDKALGEPKKMKSIEGNPKLCSSFTNTYVTSHPVLLHPYTHTHYFEYVVEGRGLK
jgi:hypothetical protein